MEHFGEEFHVGGLGGVLLAEVELEFEEPSVPGGPLGSLDEGSPLVEVALLGGGVDALVLLVAQLLQISDQPFLGWIAHIINMYQGSLRLHLPRGG